MRQFLPFLPDEIIPVLVIGAGLAIIVGARGLGRQWLTFAAAMIVLPVLLMPLFDALPPLVLGALIVVLILGAAAAAFTGFSSLLIGRKATDHMVGTLAASFVWVVLRSALSLLLLPIRLAIGLLSRLLRR